MKPLISPTIQNVKPSTLGELVDDHILLESAESVEQLVLVHAPDDNATALDGQFKLNI